MSMDVVKVEKAFEGFDAQAEKALEDFHCAGVAVAVVKGGKVVFSRGFGYRDVKSKAPVDADTIFAIGSASKAFCSMAVGLLVDEGKLEWDKPVREYMPDFKLMDSFASERMTPRDLLCHRSGLPRHDLMWYSSPLSRKEIYQRLRYLEPNRDFRTHFQYQNLMYLTAGYLVEVVSGLTWEQYTQRGVFKPLGMKRSNFSVEDTKKADNYALPYMTKEHQPKETPFRNIDAVGPAGSINSCLNDMTKWVMLHLGKGSYKGRQVISEGSIGQMHTPTMPVPSSFFSEIGEFKEIGDINYGLAWFMHSYRGPKLIHHGGNIDGFSSLISFMPDEDMGVVVLTNQNSSMLPFLLTFTLYDRLLGLSPIDWHQRMLDIVKKGEEAEKKGEQKNEELRHKDTKPSHALEAYTGEYVHPGYGPFKVTLKDGELKGLVNALELDMPHYHYDTFSGKTEALEGMELKISFTTDADGNIASLSLPIEPNVKDIVFTRVASAEMRSRKFLEKLAGQYLLEDGKEIKISLRGEDTLLAAVPGMPELELEPYQGQTFKVKSLPIVSVAFKEEKDAITGLEIIQPGAVIEAKKQ